MDDENLRLDLLDRIIDGDHEELIAMLEASKVARLKADEERWRSYDWRLCDLCSPSSVYLGRHGLAVHVGKMHGQSHVQGEDQTRRASQIN